MGMIFDTHAHYDDEAFDLDREELLASLKEQGIDKVIDAGSTVKSLSLIPRLTKEYSFLYGALGLHPDEVGDMSTDRIEEIRMLSRDEKIVAIGEIGLDYHWNVEAHEEQIRWFEAQLTLAREEKLPVIIHSRDAAADTLATAKRMKMGEIGGVVHCFSYGKEMAREYLDMGMHLGIGGVITFKNARKLKEVVEYTPLDRILLETDCPYLAPEPNRGKRNSSLNLPYVAEAIAALKGVSTEEVIDCTEKNAYKLFFKES